MKPELVDAAFRRKAIRTKSSKTGYEEPALIDNFRALERGDISDLLQVDNNTNIINQFLNNFAMFVGYFKCGQ